MKYAAAWPGVYDPIAVQALADTHETPFRATSLELTVSFAGLGVDSTRQVLPSHLSANVGPGGLKSVPVAVQACDDVHETASSIPAVLPCGNGTDCACQLVPFHDAASGTAVPLVLSYPTAVHACVLEHEIARSSMVVAGPGICSMLQLVPSHLSTIVCGRRAFWEEPTAMHDLAEVHETAKNEAGELPGAVGRTCQRLPSHASVRIVWRLPAMWKALPTAMQVCVDGHETA
jgi:hypothetical protein